MKIAVDLFYSLGTGVSILLSMSALGDRAEKLAPDTLKKSVRSLLLADRAANDFGIHSKILAQSGGIMDIAFGPKRVSWRAFVGSAVLSVAAAVVLYLLFLAFGQVEGPYWDKFKSRGSRGLLIVGFSVLVYNLVPDYLSLIESRWTLSRMIAAQRAIPLFLWLVFDIAASAAIITASIFLAASAAHLFDIHIFGFREGATFLEYYLEAMKANVSLHSPGAIFFYSAFATSLFVLFYWFTFLAMRFLIVTRWIKGFVLSMKIEEQPLLAMGSIAGLFFGICGAIAVFVVRTLAIK